MQSKSTISKVVKQKNLTILKCGVFSLLASLSFSAYSQLLDLADLPVTSVSTAPTNIIVTFDNEEDSMGLAYSEPGTDFDEVYARSSQFNKFAYDPSITYEPPFKADGTLEANADFNAAIRGVYSSTPVAVDLSNEYRTIRRIVYNEGVETPRFADELGCDNDNCGAYYFVHRSIFPGCDVSRIPDNAGCYSRVEIGDFSSRLIAGFNGRSIEEERTNFANWYQYYSVRLNAAKTALRLAFAPQNVTNSVRVGRQTSRDRSSIQSGSPQADVAGVSSFANVDERENFYSWLSGVELINNPELRESFVRVGDYVTEDSAYEDVPGDIDTLQACRRNEHILITSSDAVQGDAPAETFLDANGSFSLPDGEVFSSASLPDFKSSSLDSIENIAFHYWATDAFGDTNDNDVPPLLGPGLQFSNLAEDYFDPSNDPAQWQHVRTSVVNLGSESDGNVENLRQAAINSRGRFVNLENLSELVGSIANIVAVPDNSGSLAAVASASGRAAGDSLIYTAEFDTELKIGHLRAQRFSDGSDFVLGQEGVACNEKIFGTLCGEEWDAARENTQASPTFSEREIITFNPDLSTHGEGVDFEYDQLNATQQSLLNDGNDAAFGQALVDYLSGDVSNEFGSGGDELFRTRSEPDFGAGTGITYLGPIVNSAPLYVGDGRSNGVNTFNFAEQDNLPEASSYNAYVDGTVTNRPPLVLVGANDGMLHVYDASASADGGEEILAYVPNKVFANLADYANPAYGHRAYVDGPLSYQDAYVENEWKTIVIGGLRTGGQGYFALDISRLSNNNTDADDIAIWEFTDETDGAENLGYSFGEAQIVRSNLSSGKWVALIPSGYNATEDDGRRGSGRASLFVVDLDDGEILREIEVGGTADNLASPNGLSSISAITVDDDINVEYAYAGDLKGRLWKFDLRDSSISNWSAGLLYDAGDDRPITAKPVVGRRPDGGGGQIVYFGTGQLLQDSDVSNSDRQAFYGVLDNASCNSLASACVQESDLTEQQFSGGSERTVSSDAVDFASDKGFFIELVVSGGSAERVIAPPILIGSTVAFVSVLPEEADCGAGAENFLNVVSRFDGGSPPNPPLVDRKGEALVVNSLPVVGIRLDNEYSLQGVTLLAGDGKASFNVPAGNPAGELGATGRLRWRQLR